MMMVPPSVVDVKINIFTLIVRFMNFCQIVKFAVSD